MAARDLDRLGRGADDMRRATGKRPGTLTVDLTVSHEVDALAARLEEASDVQVLVNCAGGSRPTPVDAGDNLWDEAFAVNFTAARRLTGAAVPGMVARGWGRVVNISGSMEPRSSNAATAAKGALHLWSKGLSCDLAPRGVTVNCVAPGRIDSAQTREQLHPTARSRDEFITRNIPIGRFGEPAEIAALVAFLCSPIAGYVTGAVIPVDGGMHYFAH